MPPKGPRLAQPGRSPPEAPAGQELDGATLERLQQQLLEDDEFADDMRALLLARFRAKHRKKSGGAPQEEGGSEASDEHSSDGTADEESEPDPAELNRLRELGYELQPHERLLSKGKVHLCSSRAVELKFSCVVLYERRLYHCQYTTRNQRSLFGVYALCCVRRSAHISERSRRGDERGGRSCGTASLR